MSGVEIQRDYESFDGEIGGPMDVFWTRGHGHDPDEVVRAAIALSLEWGSVPRIDEDDAPVEMWQQNVRIADGIEYRRTKSKPSEDRHCPAFPVTVLDLDRRRAGAHPCAFKECRNPWQVGSPLRVVVGPDEPYRSVTIHACAEHRRLMPEPYYRAVVVPVGAEIVLPAPSDDGTVTQ